MSCIDNPLMQLWCFCALISLSWGITHLRLMYCWDRSSLSYPRKCLNSFCEQFLSSIRGKDQTLTATTPSRLNVCHINEKFLSLRNRNKLTTARLSLIFWALHVFGLQRLITFYIIFYLMSDNANQLQLTLICITILR